jgi:hypothetical protein
MSRTIERVKVAKSAENEADRQLAVGAGDFYGLLGFNALASAQYILVFDSATTPIDGSIPDFMVIVQATSSFAFGFGELGYPFTNGLYICNSSTQETKTIGAADCWFNAQLTKRNN